MKTIETNEDLVQFLADFECDNGECILRVYDNKSDVLLQTVVVKHPVVFIRGIQEFCKTISIPVSDISVRFIGMIDCNSLLYEVPEICEISPYVYFKKPEETQVSNED